MYHPVEIEKLSEPQIRKLVRGMPVRVKHGKGHVIHASTEQHKKIIKAHLKGKGVTLSLDPYQCENHMCLVGSGFMSTVKRAYGHAKSAYGHAKSALGQASNFYGENRETLDPYANILKRQATQQVEHYSQKAQPHLTRHLGEFGSHLGEHARQSAISNIQDFGNEPHPSIETPEQIEHEMGGRLMRHRKNCRGGKITLKDVGKFAKSGLNAAGQFAKSPAGQAIINAGVKAAIAGATGAGMRKRGRPAKHRGGDMYGSGMSNSSFHGGALVAAGY